MPWDTGDKVKAPPARRRTDENMREPLREVRHNVKLASKTKQSTRDWFGEKEHDMLKLKVTKDSGTLFHRFLMCMISRLNGCATKWK